MEKQLSKKHLHLNAPKSTSEFSIKVGFNLPWALLLPAAVQRLHVEDLYAGGWCECPLAKVTPERAKRVGVEL